ncbi:hypothetical protein-transmembrane prediction [Rhodopirellula baltica SH 1]|uniref:Uncharacterized protein n=1 Tax=Rhodopirellula baltica (strain DSM 10527 / NCIMB 13988 / SH1) TaxID=243090 RepID=Q7UKV7_RHOBA|nr:hypothetical protein-transmembrane prediction [Rhodopirellula baltica SH 1]
MIRSGLTSTQSDHHLIFVSLAYFISVCCPFPGIEAAENSSTKISKNVLFSNVDVSTLLRTYPVTQLSRKSIFERRLITGWSKSPNTTALSFGPSASCDAFGVDAEFGVSVELRLRMADASRYVA